MTRTTTDLLKGPGLALEIAGLCAFVVPSDGEAPIQVLCPGAKDVPRHKPYLLVPIADVDRSHTADPDFTLELERTTHGLWSVDGCKVSIEADSMLSSRPRLPEGSASPTSDGFWNNIWHHLVDIGRLVSPAKVSAEAVEKCAATMVLAGGERAEIIGLSPNYRRGSHFKFEPKGWDPAYEPHLTDRVRYWLGSTKIEIVLTRRGEEPKKIALDVKDISVAAALWNLPSSFKTGTHTHGRPDPLSHFTAFYKLLEGDHPNPPVPEPLEKNPMSGTAFCPPAVIQEP